MLEAVEIVYAGVRIGYTRYRAEPQESFASEVVRCEHVMVHHREKHHSVRTSTLFDAYGAENNFYGVLQRVTSSKYIY